MIITSVSLPEIKSHFSHDILATFLQRSKNRFYKISLTTIKKIRSQDIGKARDYLKLMKEYMEYYERKEAEEKNYEAKNKELIEKMPRIPLTGGTMRFKRMDS